MSGFKRCFTKSEAEEIRPYLKYYLRGFQGDLDLLFSSIESGWIYRTPVVEEIASNYKIANPGERLPNCLKL
jgi:hypothetical protein